MGSRKLNLIWVPHLKLFMYIKKAVPHSKASILQFDDLSVIFSGQSSQTRALGEEECIFKGEGYSNLIHVKESPVL